jgi:hypothetical protein
MALTPDKKARLAALLADRSARKANVPRGTNDEKPPRKVHKTQELPLLRRQAFAAQYVRHMGAANAAATAAEEVGYAPGGGKRLKQMGNVRDMIADECQKVAERARIETADVVEGLLKEAKREDDEGGSSGNRISAWVQIGRHLGMFQDRVKVEVTDDLSPERRAMILALVQQTLVVAGPAIEYAAEVIDIDGDEEDAE